MDEPNSIFGDVSPSKTRVYRWYGEFNYVRSSLQDEFRESCSKSVVIPKTSGAVRKLILQVRPVIYRVLGTI